MTTTASSCASPRDGCDNTLVFAYGTVTLPQPEGSNGNNIIASDDGRPTVIGRKWLIKVPDSPLHPEAPTGSAMLTIMAAFAQLERDTIIERTRAGWLLRPRTGVSAGAPARGDDADAAKARQLRDKGITAVDIAKMLRVSRANRVPVPHRVRSAREMCAIYRMKAAPNRWRLTRPIDLVATPGFAILPGFAGRPPCRR